MIADYKARYEELGAERVMAIATSAVRDASNGDAFIAELRERFDIDARLLTGEEEAHLTYLGATAQRAATEATDPRLRHRRRLHRADRRRRQATSTSTPRCRPGRSATPSAT